MTPLGFPHSDIFGSKLVWQLPEAFRSLLRPSSVSYVKASIVCAYVTFYECNETKPRFFLIVPTSRDCSFSKEDNIYRSKFGKYWIWLNTSFAHYVCNWLVIGKNQYFAVCTSTALSILLLSSNAKYAEFDRSVFTLISKSSIFKLQTQNPSHKKIICEAWVYAGIIIKISTTRA